MFKFYEKHFGSHGLSVQQVYNDSHNIISAPLCPICGKETEFVKNKWFYRKFCCVQHQVQYIDVETGLRFGWSIENINDHNYKIWDSGHKSCIARNKKYGSEFATELTIQQREARGLINDFDYAEWQDKQRYKKSISGIKGGFAAQKLYGCHAKSVGYTSIVNITPNT